MNALYHPEARREAAVGSMTRQLDSCLLIVVWVFASTPISAQSVRTDAPCSPVIDRTQGNVTVNFTGGCTAGMTPTELQQIIDAVLNKRAVALESFEELAQRFGVTSMAVTTFFRILGENRVPIEDLDAKLREVASQHLTLLQRVETLSAEDDPQVASIKKRALAAISTGDYARAQALLEQAFDADLVAARKAQDSANKALETAKQRYLTAAKTKADLGELKLSQLQYEAASREFQTAADLVPASVPLIRARYLASSGMAAYDAGIYPLAESALTEALRIREKLLSPNHADVARSLGNLASLYRAQGRYSEAEPLSKRAVAISEKTFGPGHPNVSTHLSNLADLYRLQGRYAEAEPLIKRALAISEKVLPPEHPVVASRLSVLANLYRVARPLCRGRAFDHTRPCHQREGAWSGASGCRHPSQQPRVALPGASRLSPGRTFVQARPRHQREDARTGASGCRHPSQRSRIALPGAR